MVDTVFLKCKQIERGRNKRCENKRWNLGLFLEQQEGNVKLDGFLCISLHAAVFGKLKVLEGKETQLSILNLSKFLLGRWGEGCNYICRCNNTKKKLQKKIDSDTGQLNILCLCIILIINFCFFAV